MFCVISLLLCLMFSNVVCLNQQCNDDICEDDSEVDIPLISKLNAPLKAELDISAVNTQIIALIKREIKKAINHTVAEVVKKEAEKVFSVLKQTLKSNNNDSIIVDIMNIVEHNSQLDMKIENLTASFKESSKRVAISACVSGGGRQEHGIVRFPDVKMDVGISNVSTFKTTGIFKCEYHGLYQITLTIMSEESDKMFRILKNGVAIMSGYTTYHDVNQRWHSSTISSVVSLDIKDNLWVYTGDMNVYTVYSCVTIVKLK